MNVIKVRNPKFTEAGAVDCEIFTAGEWYPFNATADDSMAYGKKIYQEVVDGKWGEVQPYEATEKAFSEASSVMATKAGLMSNAEAMIAPLSRAVKYDIATDAEKAALEAWERYTVMLSRVDVDNPVWPDTPES